MSETFSPRNKVLSLIACVMTVILGLTAFAYKANYEGSVVSCFREMTVDGTLFTCLVAIIIGIQRIRELRARQDLPSRPCYFLHLSAAVTEELILLVVLIGSLPFFPDHPVFLRYDMINMHVLLPLITMTTFVLFSQYPGKLRPHDRLNGLIFIICYAVIMISLILLNVIPESKIPYSFLNVRHCAPWYLLLAFVVLFGNSIAVSWWMTRANCRAASHMTAAMS